MNSVYVLKLQKDKYYVGKSKNLRERILKHFSNPEVYWVKKYRPISIYKIYYNCDNYDEDKYTIMHMEKFGIANVRGGSFSTLYLDLSTINFIRKLLNTANDKCFFCGSCTHFLKSCKIKKSQKFKGYKYFLDVYHFKSFICVILILITFYLYFNMSFVNL